MSKVQYDADTQIISIPEVAGVTYSIDDVPVSGSIHIDEDTIVTAAPDKGMRFPEGVETEWLFEVKTPEQPTWDRQNPS